MNIVELEEALFPGGKPTEDLSKTVEELKAVHGADHIADLLREWQQLLGTQYLGALRQAGVVSDIMPLTDEHKRRAAEAMERQNEPPNTTLNPEPRNRPRLDDVQSEAGSVVGANRRPLVTIQETGGRRFVVYGAVATVIALPTSALPNP